MSIATTNPANGETIKTFEPESFVGLETRLGAAESAFKRWREVPFSRRAELLRKLADLFESRAPALAHLMALEMGKPLAAGRPEAQKCAAGARYYADNAERFLADLPHELPGKEAVAFTRFLPLGPVLAIMPWNFPLWQVIRFSAPALMAGNVVLLKHASNVPQCALELEQLHREAGFPPGVFQTLLITSRLVKTVIEDRRITAVTLTGSDLAGREVAEVAGRAVKKTVLELGGSDPFIVMPSASLDRAAAAAVEARVVNSGQSCIAAKRFLVHDAIYDAFAGKFTAAMGALVVGDPFDEKTKVGPLATASILRTLEEQVARAVEAGARVMVGGRRLDRPGNFFQPTVLADPPRTSPGFDDELFGPVALLYRVYSVAEAIELANATQFGLGASVWTHDKAEQEQFINGVRSGFRE